MQRLILRFIYSVFFRLYLRVIIGVQFKRPKFLANEKQFIIVANHNSHLDTISLLASLPSSIIHKVKPVAAQDYFGTTSLKGKLTNYFLNTLLIQRKRDKENPENDPINRMLAALDKGYSLILFPEGTRGKPEEEQELKPGIGLVLSQRPTVKYLPAYMKGMGKALPKGESLVLPYSSTLLFGELTTIKSTDVGAIVEQVAEDFERLKQQIESTQIKSVEEKNNT